MQPPKPSVHVDDESYPDAPIALIRTAVRSVLEEQGGEDVEVSVALLPDNEMRRLNREYLDSDRTTDVLAFALEGGDHRTVGDVYLGYDQALRQAEEVGITLSEELARLAIHGTLHVLGHDHPEGPERLESAMFRLQEEILGRVMKAPGSGA